MKDTPFIEARLLSLYDRVAEAEDAIPRLRRFVLDLAVRGKLVPQEAQDEVVESGFPSDTKGAPYSLPDSWRWTTIGRELDLLNGMAFKPTDWVREGVKIVRIQNLNNENASFNFCANESVRARSLIDNGSFLISWSGTPGTSFGAFIWNRGPAVLNQHIFRCDFKTANFVPHFLRLAINGRLDEMIEKAHGGVGLQHITKGKLEGMFVAVPPLSEQHRIVAKFEELMALLDRLEAARAEREETRIRLTAATLSRLTEADTYTAAAARFALQTLPALTTRPDQIKFLRQTILNLAVRGKLVGQDEVEEGEKRAVSATLDQHRNEHHTYVSQCSPGTPNPFACPSGWAWVHVRDLLSPQRDISYGVIKLGPEPKSGGIPVLRCSDVKPGFIELGGVRKVEEAIEADYARTRLEGGEILINVRGTLGGVALVPGNLRGFNVAREVAVIPLKKEVFAPFIMYSMLSPFFWGFIKTNLRGIAYKGLNLGTLRDLPIPLPPLAEQHRIVAKVEDLMSLCDRLEHALQDATTTRARLFDTLLHEALAGAQEAA